MHFNGRCPRAFRLLMPIFSNLCGELSLIKSISNLHWEVCEGGGDGRSDKCFQTFLNPGVREPANLQQQEVKNRLSMERRGGQTDPDRLIIGRVKLASSRSLGSNCRSQKLWVQDVYHGTGGMRVR
jgi:hypothetical protein